MVNEFEAVRKQYISEGRTEIGNALGYYIHRSSRPWNEIMNGLHPTNQEKVRRACGSIIAASAGQYFRLVVKCGPGDININDFLTIANRDLEGTPFIVSGTAIPISIKKRVVFQVFIKETHVYFPEQILAVLW